MAFVIILTQNISKIDILIKSLKVDYTVQDNLEIYKNSENYKNIGIIFENFEDLPINFEKFIGSISKNTKYIDLISCSINENSINRIKTYENKYNKIIRYSTESIGHKIFEGTWILNSHNITIKDVYFNNNIDNWMNILGDINFNELFIKNVKRYISDLEDKNNEVNSDLSNPVVVNHTNTTAASEEKGEINSKTNLFRTEHTKLKNYLSTTAISTDDIYIEKYNEATEIKNILETLYEEIRNHTQCLSFLNCVKKAWILGQNTYGNFPIGQAYKVIEDGNLTGKSLDEFDSTGYSSSARTVTPRNLESDFMAINKRHRLIRMVTAVELYEDSKVNSIGKYAFYNTYQIKTRSLTISEHMNKIDNYAFSRVRWEIELRIKKQSGEFTIGKRAFEMTQKLYHIGWYPYNNSLSKLKLNIGDYAFVNAGIKDGNTYTNQLLYNFEFKKLGIGALSTKIMDYLPKFAQSDVSIDNLAFYNSNIPLIRIPENIIQINIGTFLECTKLTNLTLENIKILGSRAFEGCVNLQTIELNKCEQINTHAFKNCTSLNKVVTPKIKNILDYAFQGCDLENMDLNIPRNYAYIYPELMNKVISDKYDNEDGKSYNFTDYTLQYCIFTGDFTNSIFINTDFSYSTFRNIDISGVDLSSANLNKIISDNITYNQDTLLPTGYIFYNDLILGFDINAAVIDLPDGYGVFDDKLVGPKMIIDGIDLSDQDLRNIYFNFSKISNIISNNNTKLPPGYKIINNTLLGPYLNIDEIDISNQDLQNVDFTNTNIENISNYSNTILPNGLIIVDGKLVGEGIPLVNIDIEGQNLSSWNFYGMRTEGITLGTDNDGNPVKNSNAGNVILPSGYVIRNGYLFGPGVDLSYVDFREISSDGTYVNNTIDIQGIEFKDINFSYAKLSTMNIVDVHLDNINFTSADIQNVTFTRVSSSNIIPNDGNNVFMNNKYSINNGAILGSGIISNTKFINEDQSYRNYRDREYINCEFNNVTFEGTDLSNATFNKCVFTNVNMRGTNLTDVKIIESVMDTIYFSTFDKMIAQIDFKTVNTKAFYNYRSQKVDFYITWRYEDFEVKWGYPEIKSNRFSYQYRYQTYIDNLNTTDVNIFFINYGRVGWNVFLKDIKGKPDYIDNENILEFYEPYERGYVIIKKGRGYDVDTEYRLAASQFDYDKPPFVVSNEPFVINNEPWEPGSEHVDKRIENIHIYDGKPFKINRVIPNKTNCKGLTFDNVVTQNIRLNYNESDGILGDGIKVFDNMIKADGTKLPNNILGKNTIFVEDINSSNWNRIYNYFTANEETIPYSEWTETNIPIQKIILYDESEIELNQASNYSDLVVYGIKSNNVSYYNNDAERIENIDVTQYNLQYVNYNNVVTKNLRPEGYVTPQGYKIYSGRLFGQYIKFQENISGYTGSSAYPHNYETDTLNLFDNYKTKNDAELIPVSVNYAYVNKYGEEKMGYHPIKIPRQTHKIRMIDIVRYLNYKNMIFENINISFFTIKNVILNNSSFKGSVLYRVEFINCDLSNVDFTNATLINCVIIECSIKDINITNWSIYDLRTRGLFNNISIDDWTNSFDIEYIPDIMSIHQFQLKDGTTITKNFDQIVLTQGKYVVDYGFLFGPYTIVDESVNIYEYNYTDTPQYDDDLEGTQITLRERANMSDLNRVHYKITGLNDPDDIQFLYDNNIMYIPSNGTFIGKYMDLNTLDIIDSYGKDNFAENFRNINLEGTSIYRISVYHLDHLYLDRGDGEIFNIDNKANTINVSGGRLLSSFMNYKNNSLRNASYINIKVENIDLEGSSIQYCTFTDCEFRFVNFNNAGISHSTFRNCKMYGCKFNNIGIYVVTFENSSFYTDEDIINDFEFENIDRSNSVNNTNVITQYNQDIHDDTQQIFLDTTTKVNIGNKNIINFLPANDPKLLGYGLPLVETPVYLFNDRKLFREYIKYALSAVTYKFIDIPEEYPMAILNKNNSYISYTGNANQKSTKKVINTNNDGTYDFYWGDIIVEVTGNFGMVSVCSFNDAIGEYKNVLIYNENCIEKLYPSSEIKINQVEQDITVLKTFTNGTWGGIWNDHSDALNMAYDDYMECCAPPPLRYTQSTRMMFTQIGLNGQSYQEIGRIYGKENTLGDEKTPNNTVRDVLMKPFYNHTIDNFNQTEIDIRVPTFLDIERRYSNINIDGLHINRKEMYLWLTKYPLYSSYIGFTIKDYDDYEVVSNMELDTRDRNFRFLSSGKKYGLGETEYKIINIPQSHPIAIISDSGNILYNGDDDKKTSKNIAISNPYNIEFSGKSGTYDFYWGDITVTVIGDFGKATIWVKDENDLKSQGLDKLIYIHDNILNTTKYKQIFENSRLTYVSFINCDLRHTQFVKTRLKFIDFDNTDLRSSAITKSELSNVDFSKLKNPDSTLIMKSVNINSTVNKGIYHKLGNNLVTNGSFLRGITVTDVNDLTNLTYTFHIESSNIILPDGFFLMSGKIIGVGFDLTDTELLNIENSVKDQNYIIRDIIPKNGDSVTLEDGYKLINGNIIGPYIDLSQLNMSSYDLYGMKGTNIVGNNITLPDNYIFISKKTSAYINDVSDNYRIILGPGILLNDINLDDYDFDIDGFSLEYFKGIKSENILPNSYSENYGNISERFGDNFIGLEIFSGKIITEGTIIDNMVISDNADLSQLILENTTIKNITVPDTVTLPPEYIIVNKFLLGPGINLSNQDLSVIDFASSTMMDINLTRSYGINITPKNTSRENRYYIKDGYLIGPGLYFNNQEYNNHDFKNLDTSIKPLHFKNSKLIGCDLSGLDLRNCDFSNSDLSYSNLSGCMIDKNTIFDNCNLSYSNLLFKDIGDFTFSNLKRFTNKPSDHTVTSYNYIPKYNAVNLVEFKTGRAGSSVLINPYIENQYEENVEQEDIENSENTQYNIIKYSDKHDTISISNTKFIYNTELNDKYFIRKILSTTYNKYIKSKSHLSQIEQTSEEHPLLINGSIDGLSGVIEGYYDDLIVFDNIEINLSEAYDTLGNTNAYIINKEHNLSNIIQNTSENNRYFDYKITNKERAVFYIYESVNVTNSVSCKLWSSSTTIYNNIYTDDGNILPNIKYGTNILNIPLTSNIVYFTDTDKNEEYIFVLDWNITRQNLSLNTGLFVPVIYLNIPKVVYPLEKYINNLEIELDRIVAGVNITINIDHIHSNLVNTDYENKYSDSFEWKIKHADNSVAFIEYNNNLTIPIDSDYDHVDIIYKVISEFGNQIQTYQLNNINIQYNPLINIGCRNIINNQDINLNNNTLNLFKISNHINYNLILTFTIQTNDIPIDNLTYDMLVIENCLVNDFETSDGIVYTMRVTANNGLCKITIPKDQIQIDHFFKNMETILEFTYDDIAPYIEINATVSYGPIQNGKATSTKPILLIYSNQDNYQMIDSNISITDSAGDLVDSKYITSLSYDNELDAYTHQFEPFINDTYNISIAKDLYTDSANNRSLASSFSIIYNAISPEITLERVTPYLTNDNPIILKLISTKRLGYTVDTLYRRIKPDNVTFDITNSSVNENNTQYTMAFIPDMNIQQDIEIIIPAYTLVDITNIPSIDSNFIGWDYFKENLQVTISSPDIEQYANISVDIVNLEIKIQDNLQSITYQDSTDYFITNNFDKFDIQTTCAVTEFSYNQTTKIYNIKCIAQLYGSQRVYIPDGVITDKYGNKSLSTEFIWSYDKTVPKIQYDLPDVINQDGGITYDKNLVFKFDTFKNNDPIEKSDLIPFNAIITGIERQLIPRTTRSNININKTDDFTYDVNVKFDENKNTIDELKDIIKLENDFSSIDFDLIKINKELIGYFKYQNISKFLPDDYNTLPINDKHYVSKEIINKIANTFTTLNRFHVDIKNTNSNGLEFNYDFKEHKNKLRVYPFDNNFTSDNNFTIDINTILDNEAISIPHIDINKYIKIQNGADYVKITKNSETSYEIEDQTDSVINTRNAEDGEELDFNNIKFLLGSILSDSEPIKAIDIIYIETQFPGESSITLKENAITSETGVSSEEHTIEWTYESYEPIILISSDIVNNNETHNQDTIPLKLLSSTYTNDFTKQDIYKENGQLNNFIHILYVKTANGKFIINDEEAPSLTFKSNTKYRFYQSDPSNVNHPIRFSTTSDGTHSDGTQYNLTVFNYGTIGESGSYTDIYITNTELYYYCANHSGMGNLISISEINSTPSKEYIVDFSATSVGNCLINIPANQFTDYLTGGKNITSNNLTFIFDNSQPSIVISSDDIISGGVTNLSSISLLCTFSKSIINFSKHIFTIQNGTINIVDTSTSGDSFLITFSPDSPGDCSIEIKEANVSDDIGNTNSSSNIFTFNYNVTKPTIKLSTNDIIDNSISNKNIISFSITTSEKLIGFSQDDITLQNGTIENFNASETLYTLDFKVTDQGETSIYIPENIASDVTGNQNISSNVFNWIYDSIRPSVTITSEQVNSGDISNDNSITIISTFSKEIIDFSLDKFDVTNANLSVISNNLTNDNFVFTFLLTPINQGDITLKLQENQFQDNIGNQNDESNLFTWKYDVESPSINIISDDVVLNSKTSKSEIVMYLTPSVPSKKFYGTDDNFNIVNGAVSDFITIINVTVSNGKFIIDGVSQKSLQFTPNKKYRFDQSDQSNSGHPLRLSQTNDGTHTNGGLNYNQNIIVVGVPGTPGSYIDVIITSNITLYYFCSNHPNMGSIISYNINDEEVWNKFQISFTPKNPGICSLQVKNNVFENLQGSLNLSSNIFEFNYDNVKPTPVLSSIQINSGDQSNDNFIYLTCQFDKPISGFSIDGFEITNGVLSITNNPSISSGQPESTYELLFTPTTNGASTIKLKENQFPDSIGNLNNESNIFTWYVYSGNITVSISSNDVQKDALTNKNIINMNIVLSSESDDFSKDSITTKNGNIDFIKNSKTEYVVTFTSLLNGPCSITINTGTFTDTYGNQNSFADYSWNYDNVKPNITISSDDVEHDNQINERKVSLNFTLSESTTTFDIEDIVVENGTLENFTGSGTSYSVDFVATIESICSIYVPVESFVDDANNSNLESNTYSWTYYAITEYDFGTPEVPINETASVKVSVVDIVDGQEIIKTNGRVSAYVQLPGPTEEPKLRTGDGGAKIESTTVTTPDGDIQIVSAALSIGFIDEDYGELTASFRYMDTEGNMFYCSEDNNLTLKIGDIVPDPETSSITDTHKLIIDHNYGVANEVVQSLTIKPGWNWISFYVILDDTDLTILQTESDLKDSLIKYNSGAKSFSIHYGEWGWYPTTLTYWEMMNSYQFFYPGTDPITITLTGKNTPINKLTLREGWNWIGFSYTENHEISEVILTATPGDFIKKKSGNPAFSQYYDGIGWFPGNFVIIPGEGYQYKSIDSKEISLN